MIEVRTRTLRELARVVFTRWLMVVLIIAVITGATLAACLRAQKAYRSSVTFLAREPRPQNPTAQQVSSDRSLEVFIKTQNELITSQTVLARTLWLLRNAKSPLAGDLAKAREALTGLDREPAASQPAAEPAGTGQAIVTFRQALSRIDAEVEKATNSPTEGADFREQLRRFPERVKVETPGGEKVALSEIFTVTVTLPGTPENARHAADLLASCYIDRYREVQADSGQRGAVFMRTRLDAFKQERLARAEADLRRFVEKELDSPSDVGILEQLGKSGTEAGRQIVVRRFQEELISIDGELAESTQLKQQLLEQLPPVLWGDKPRKTAAGEMTVPAIENVTEAKLPSNDSALTETVTIIPEKTIRSNVVVTQLKGKEVNLIMDLNRLRVEYNDDYRGVKDKMFEIARTRRDILRELISEAASLDIASAVLKARRAELASKLETDTNRLDRITRQLVRYQELQHEVGVAREEYRRLSIDLASAEQFQTQEADAITINIVDPARLPDVKRPAFPNTPLFTVLAAAVSILLSVTYAFLADHFDHTFRSIAEVERYLGVPVVGSIGHRRFGLVR